MSAPDPGLSRALRPILDDVAGRGATITYRDLAAAAEVPPPHTIHKTALALEEMIRADHDAGRPILAAVCVGKTGRPRPGFFHVLRDLGRYDGPDEGPAANAHHDAELEEVYAVYRA